MKRVIIYILSLIAGSLYAQNEYADISMSNRIYDEDILSMKMEKQNARFALPVIMLHSEDKLIFKFDDKTDEPKYMRYTFIHCTYDWKPTTGLNKNEYMGMFEDMEIREFQTSINTIQFYTSYTITFPNEDMYVTKSGNYVLYIYDEDSNEPILTHRFCVSENLVDISLSQSRANEISKKMTHQQLELTIKNDNFRLLSPGRYLKTIICQNGRHDNAVLLTQPDNILGNTIIYNRPDAILYEGGAEFRIFNIRTLRTTLEHVLRHERVADVNYTHLYMDASNAHTAYQSDYDINGCYFVCSDDGDSIYSADYTNVHFYLNANKPENMDLYVYGELTDWELLPQAKMTYNNYKQVWETSLYLKSGYYNYTYIAIPTQGGKGTFQYTEGNHWETQNRYQAFVYYQGDNLGYDRLIGIAETETNVKTP